MADYAEHPLLRALYFGLDVSINTDAGGVMGTDLNQEFKQAEAMIKAFKKGMPIEIDGKPVYYKDLGPRVKNRFDVTRLEEASRSYQGIDRDNKTKGDDQ